MIKVAVLDDYQDAATKLADWGALGPEVSVTSFTRHLGDPDEAARVLAQFDIICVIRERMPVQRALLERLPRLKLLVFTGKSSEVIDFDAAAERGVTVCHTAGGGGGGGGPSAVVEHTWGLILACMRNICEENEGIRSGTWSANVGYVLGGKTLGILGLGRVGRDVARIGKVFGTRLISWSPTLTAERAEAAGATLVSEEEFFREADIVSVHLRLNEATRGLVGSRQIGWMKPTAVVVNTARGPIVDEVALVSALREKRIRMAALDVFDAEPLPAGHPFLGLGNAILTPHIGYVTDTYYRSAFKGMLEVVEAWLGGAPIHRVTEAAA